jgi:hypothetical protein
MTNLPLALKGKGRLQAFENKGLTRIFISMREEQRIEEK